jgi:RHS repeat-associated protein
MTTMPQPGNWSASYSLTFDAWNRLVQIASGQTTVAAYAYDARNFRVLKTTGGATSHFYYSSQWQVLEERVPNPQSLITASQNVWGLRYVDDLILRDRNAESAPNTGNLGQTGSGLDERLYALQDPNWNTAAVSTLGGSIQERYCYTAYGQPTFLIAAFGNPGISSTCAFDTLYTGREFDPESGLFYYRARHYGAEVARFVTRDPIAAEINLYRYVRNKPLVFLDPSGLSCESDFALATEGCNDIAIQCNRDCWKRKPPWPIPCHSWAHRAYCESKCQADYMLCYAGAEAIYAACKAAEAAENTFNTMAEALAWLAAHPGVVVGTLVVVAGVAFVVATGGSGGLILVAAAAA